MYFSKTVPIEWEYFEALDTRRWHSGDTSVHNDTIFKSAIFKTDEELTFLYNLKAYKNKPMSKNSSLEGFFFFKSSH